ncbi:flagellar hook-length control protein FliK [Lentibacillus sp.]|uniref:flagellar hook-length control protein FliK n=1 Tax=Lentibacillus sp. TaxID=1925746 RepID=UPI002B4B27BF|nr:flagellar hook-length control protein FliK [Lentibacillus sp.]HLS07993.1 flagellar hook-length control protein FliK [Lentibacillus sp.]
MNAVGMMFQQVMQTKGASRQTRANAAEGDKQVFQNLLTNSKTSKSQSLNTQKEGQGKMSLVKMLLGADKFIDRAAAKEEILQKLEALLAMNKDGTESAEVMQMLKETLDRMAMGQDGPASTEAAIQLVEKSIDTLNLEQESKTAKNTEDNKAVTLLANMQAAPEVLNKEVLQKQFEALFAKVEKLLSQITDQKSTLKVASELLKVLEQWAALEKKSNHQSSMIFESGKHNGKEQTIWRELVQAFQKRHQLVSKQQYNTNAKVTSTDVAKWLQNAIKSQGQPEKTFQQSMTFTSSMPLSKIEQYVIHLNQTQNAQPADQQLIEQFQKVMKTSKFLTMQNGTSQLNMTLRPENLGDMMVKLTQMNGEMTVKIVVTSAAAKEMLEANMHQLKSMFSPQQVVVEKQEITSQQAQTHQRDHGEGEHPMDDHDEGQSDHSEQHDNPEDEEDFDSQFQKVLMNEEVS